jgi:hypothetical protein
LPRACHLKCLTAFVTYFDSLERLVEDAAGRADERMPLLVLLVAGLFPHEHRLGVLRAFTEDGLSTDLPEVAASAAGRGFAERAQRSSLREEIRRRSRRRPSHV